MRGFGAERKIESTPAELWPLIGDITRHGEWSADSLEIGEVGPGRFSSRANARGRTFTAQIEVLTSRPPELLEFRVRDSTGTYCHRIGLVEAEGGTTVTRQVTPDRLSPAQKLLATAARSLIRIPALRTSLELLAHRVEMSP